MDVQVTAYRQQDRAEVLALAERLAEGTPPWRDQAAVRRAVAGWVREALRVQDPEGSPVWVARAGGQVVGFVHAGTRGHWAGDTDAYVAELAVAEEMAGQGVGRVLMERVEDWARDRGHSRLTLETGHGNVGARAFYERLGYVTEEVVLTRALPPRPGAD